MAEISDPKTRTVSYGVHIYCGIQSGIFFFVPSEAHVWQLHLFGFLPKLRVKQMTFQDVYKVDRINQKEICNRYVTILKDKQFIADVIAH